MSGFLQEALNLIKVYLAGQPSFCRLVIYESLRYCNFSEGIISVPTLEELALTDFHVMPAPGRKKESINADTLRNAFRTIKKASPQHFIFTVQNQRIIIEMPFLRDLYQAFHVNNTQVAAEGVREVVECKTLANSGFSSCSNAELSSEDARDLAAASFRSIENINKNKNKIKNNNNKACEKNLLSVERNTLFNSTHKPTGVLVAVPTPEQLKDLILNSSTNLKKRIPISDHYFPSQNVINKALARGYIQVADPIEVQKFIDYNKALGSEWADFDSIYLRWLAKGQASEKCISKSIRSISNANPTTRTKRRTTAPERVRRACGEFDYDERTRAFTPKHEPTSCNDSVALDANDQSVWDALLESVR